MRGPTRHPGRSSRGRVRVNRPLVLRQVRAGMKAHGFEPATVIETSPGDFQALSRRTEAVIECCDNLRFMQSLPSASIKPVVASPRKHQSRHKSHFDTCLKINWRCGKAKILRIVPVKQILNPNESLLVIKVRRKRLA
jgi:hypothetical protein